MPDITPKEDKATPKPERIEFSKTARIAVRELNKNLQVGLMEIAESFAEDRGLTAEDGWRFDPQTLSFVRPGK